MNSRLTHACLSLFISVSLDHHETHARGNWSSWTRHMLVLLVEDILPRIVLRAYISIGRKPTGIPYPFGHRGSLGGWLVVLNAAVIGPMLSIRRKPSGRMSFLQTSNMSKRSSSFLPPSRLCVCWRTWGAPSWWKGHRLPFRAPLAHSSQEIASTSSYSSFSSKFQAQSEAKERQKEN